VFDSSFIIFVLSFCYLFGAIFIFSLCNGTRMHFIVLCTHVKALAHPHRENENKISFRLALIL
jgi:hypothetical protein